MYFKVIHRFYLHWCVSFSNHRHCNDAVLTTAKPCSVANVCCSANNHFIEYEFYCIECGRKYCSNVSAQSGLIFLFISLAV